MEGKDVCEALAGAMVLKPLQCNQSRTKRTGTILKKCLVCAKRSRERALARPGLDRSWNDHPNQHRRGSVVRHDGHFRLAVISQSHHAAARFLQSSTPSVSNLIHA
jgi:hypothetical protein